MTLLDPHILIAYILGGLTFVPILMIVRSVLTMLAHVAWPTSKQPSPCPSRLGATIKTEVPDQHHKVGSLHVVCGQHQKPHESAFGEIVKYITRSTRRFEKEYYATLKANTLYLYDSEKRQDSKYVVALDHYHVSIHPPAPDHELFTRPQTIRLQPKNDSTLPNYYLNCTLCIDKEDWYFELLRASQYARTTHAYQPPPADPTLFDPTAMHQLIASVYSAEQHTQIQWFNAFLGRVFCAIYKTETIKDALHRKIVSKMDKLNAKLPSLIRDIEVRSVDPGHALPQITEPKLISLSPSGELIAEANVHYQGSFRVEVATLLKLPPGVTVDIALAITLKSLSGKCKLKIKEPPTNRFWYGFEGQPTMEWLVEPVVSKKPIGYPMVVEAIVAQLEELVRDTVVLPNMDDVVFFPAEGAGGIFADPPKLPPSPTVSSPVTDTRRRPWLSPSSSTASSPIPTPSVSNTTTASDHDLLDLSPSPPRNATLAPMPSSPDGRSASSVISSPGTLSSSLDSVSTAPTLNLSDFTTAGALSKHDTPTTPLSILSGPQELDPSYLMPDTPMATRCRQRKLRKAASASMMASTTRKSIASVAVSSITVSLAATHREPSQATAIGMLETKRTASIA